MNVARQASDQLQTQRRERLAAAAKRAGGNAALGKLLGYRDGAFVGQMLRGERPITEGTVAKLHSCRGWRGWFEALNEAGEQGQIDALSTEERQLVADFRDLLPRQQREVLAEVHARAEELRGYLRERQAGTPPSAPVNGT